MIDIRSPHLDGVEVAWFAPLCSGDGEFLGIEEPKYRASFDNTADVVYMADKMGFRNILCPSSYIIGQDTLAFAAAVAPQTKQINLLTAIRCGEVHPPMLARAISTLDHILEGRLTINIISSEMPGEVLDSHSRYERSREVIEILKQCWTQDHINFSGRFYNLKLDSTDPVRPYQTGGPLLYFGGYSPEGKDLCAQHCDVYLMWPDSEDQLQNHMQDVAKRAAAYGRKVDFGLRIHVIVREDEQEARNAAEHLVSRLDPEVGEQVKNRAQDAKSLGVALQSQTRDRADEAGYLEPNVWTGIGRGRSGCGAALVGTPEQILAKLHRYMDMGIKAFIFSGYPHKEEAERFGRLVMPHLKTVSLPVAQGRIPATPPMTPLAAGEPRRASTVLGV